MFIRMKSAVGRHKAGDLIEVDDVVGKAYIDDGLAEDGDAAAKDALKTLGMNDIAGAFKDFSNAFSEAMKATVEDIKRTGSGFRVEPGASQDDKTKSLGDFTVQVLKAANVQDLDGMGEAQTRLRSVYGSNVKKGMEEATGTTGGFWTVPTEMATTILEESWEDAVMLPGSTNVPLGAKAMEWPVLDQYQVPSKGQSAQFGGVTVSRKGEVSKRDQTRPGGKKIKLEANDLTAMTEYSRDLNDDAAGSLSAMLTKLIGGAIGWRRDWEHMWGSGEGMCLGIFAAACLAMIRIARQKPGVIVYPDITKMLSRLTPSGKKRACFIAHPFHLDTLMSMTDSSGRLIFLPTMTTQGGPISKDAEWRLANLPIFFSEKAAAPGTYGDFALVDRKAYLTGQRSGLEIGISEHFLFDSDQIALRAKIRDDGQPWVQKPFTLADGAGTNQVSPFVALDVPAKPGP